MPRPMTDEEVEAIEQVIDGVISGDGPSPFPLSLARSAILHWLRQLELPVPDDGWLDDGIRNWAAFNEVEIDEAKPAQMDPAEVLRMLNQRPTAMSIKRRLAKAQLDLFRR